MNTVICMGFGKLKLSRFVQTDPDQELDGHDITYIPMEYTPGEIWDILDENGNKTGRLLERGRKVSTKILYPTNTKPLRKNARRGVIKSFY